MTTIVAVRRQKVKDQAVQAASAVLEISGTTHPLTVLNPRRPDSAVALCFWKFCFESTIVNYDFHITGAQYSMTELTVGQ